MAPFDDKTFYERDLMNEIEPLKEGEGRGKTHARRLERLLYWYFRRKALSRGSSPKPFLFSELMTGLEDLLRGSCWKEMECGRGDFYIKARFADVLDAVRGVYFSLAAETGRTPELRSGSGEGHVISISFESPYESFDLPGFSRRLSGGPVEGCPHDAGYPYLESVAESAGGNCRWEWGEGRWNLLISMPVYRRSLSPSP